MRILARTQIVNDNKKAELSQRWPQDASYIIMGALENFESLWLGYTHGYFSRNL